MAGQMARTGGEWLATKEMPEIGGGNKVRKN